MVKYWVDLKSLLPIRRMATLSLPLLPWLVAALHTPASSMMLMVSAEIKTNSFFMFIPHFSFLILFLPCRYLYSTNFVNFLLFGLLQRRFSHQFASLSVSYTQKGGDDYRRQEGIFANLRIYEFTNLRICGVYGGYGHFRLFLLKLRVNK